MKVALRVLKKLSIREEPGQSDIAILRDAVNPNERDWAPPNWRALFVQAALLRKKQDTAVATYDRAYHCARLHATKKLSNR